MKIVNVVGARPNFMKIAPIVSAMAQRCDRISQLLIHTGQHYDEKMSKTFFEDLGIPRPDIDLEVGSGSHAQQTARVMIEFEKICLGENPDLVLVVGDVNSTIACAITAKKLGIRVAHVEAGLRSGDLTMPEEINRLCTDAIADYLFTTDHFANENLRREGVREEKIFFVGNVMIDTLLKHRAMAATLNLRQRLALEVGKYATLTLHRPSNVDRRGVLQGILEALREVSREMPIVFPIHPRTRKMVEKFELRHYFSTGDNPRGIWLIEPLGYLEFLHLNMGAKMVFTDSGGLQEETTVLGIPCLTLRENTERPITCDIGTNVLVGNRKEEIVKTAKKMLTAEARTIRIPEKWDGQAARRIVDCLLQAGSEADKNAGSDPC